MSNVARTVKYLSLVQSSDLSIPKISAGNMMYAVSVVSVQYNVTQYFACLWNVWSENS